MIDRLISFIQDFFSIDCAFLGYTKEASYSTEMNKTQVNAINTYSTDIIEIFEYAMLPFLQYSLRSKTICENELTMIKNEPTNRLKLSTLLMMLEHKKDGWKCMVTYLRENRYDNLADKLEVYIEDHGPMDSAVDLHHISPKGVMLDFIIDFKEKLRRYYQFEYSMVSTMFGCHKSLNHVWVPLKIEEKTRHPRQQDSWNHFELLKLLADSPASVALIKGHPGVGKTTLIKKIAYDWANDHIDQFDLVLVVPLRHVGKTTDFLRLTADYYTHLLHLSTDKMQLLAWMNRLGRNLLVCLDGLEEYSTLAQSPFKNIFNVRLKKRARASIHYPPPMRSYKLLITSRPYACNLIHPDFFSLKFEICPLDNHHLADFVRMYCETNEGERKVHKYLTDNTVLLINVPLILMFVCYLADLNVEIPGNLTLLYERFICHMIKREVQRDALSESIYFDNWKKAPVVKSITDIAFAGCKSGKFQFTHPTLEQFGITKDSFTCGLLLHKFDFAQESLIAEFPHRSIQEFFAALHLYQLILTSDKSERNLAMKEILEMDNLSVFGRFLFGICSEERKFCEMLEWLNPTFCDAKLNLFNFGIFLDLLSASLSDCSEAEAELLGRKLTDSLEQLEIQITKKREEQINTSRIINFSSFNKSFQSGLNLSFLDSYSWSICHIEMPRWSRLAYLCCEQPPNLCEKFDQIQVLVMVYDINKMKHMIDAFPQLPAVSTLIFHTMPAELEVNFNLSHSTTTHSSSQSTQLRHFSFGFGRDQIYKLKEIFAYQPDMDDLIIEVRRDGKVSWVEAKVNKTLSQHQLVDILIGVALNM